MARRRRGAGSESAGYHYDATPKKRTPTRTPVVAPKPSQAARGPAGDYAGADKAFAAAVASLPTAARTVTESATVAATKRQARAAGASRRKVARVARAERRRQAAALASVQRHRDRRQALRQSTDPAKAIISTRPNPQAKLPKFAGKPTAGEPTRAELTSAQHQGTLKTNRKGFATTPAVRAAGASLRDAQRLIATAGAASDLPHLDAEGDRVAGTVLRTGKRMGATRKELLAAAETGLVESGGFHNHKYGDADSEGWRQERTSLYGSDANYPKRGARNFFSETKQQSGATAGELAANVQRPAEQYRGRYDEVKPQAAAIVAAFEKGGLNARQSKRVADARKQARSVGLKVKGGVKAASKGPTPAKKRKGEWAGTKDILLKATRGIEISSEKRSPTDPLSISNPGSDHNEANENAFATDLPATGAALNQTGTKVASRLGVKGWSPGNYDWYTTPKYPGYRFQILSEVEGHFDHVHAGAEWTGEDLPAGTIAGGSSSSTTTFTPSGGGATGSVPTPPVEVGVGKARRRRGAKKGKRKLTRLEEFNRNKRELARLGVPLGGKPKEQDAHPVLQELIEKYGSANPVPTSAAERKAKALAAATS